MSMLSAPSILPFTQNFLRDAKLADLLVAMTDIQMGDTVLEIGPGKGILTSALAKRVGQKGRVVAVELDDNLHRQLQKTFSSLQQVELFHDDILRFSLKSLGQRYRVFSNIPFAITGPLLEKIFQQHSGPEKGWLILQTDTLQDFSTGKPRPTLKSLLLEPLYEIENIYDFSRSDFSPQPQADAALFFLNRRTQPVFDTRKYLLYQDFLAFISHDRVGEGAWKRLLTTKQLETVARQTHLTLHKGLKSQNTNTLTQTFLTIEQQYPQAFDKIQGAFKRLRSEQARHAQHNEVGGHHRSNIQKRIAV